MFLDALGRQAGDMAAGEPFGPELPLPHTHTEPRHTILRGWRALAQQLLFITSCGNSVIDIIIQAA